MTEQEKKEIVYLAMKDIYKEFNHSINNLLILVNFYKMYLTQEKDKN